MPKPTGAAMIVTAPDALHDVPVFRYTTYPGGLAHGRRCQPRGDRFAPLQCAESGATLASGKSPSCEPDHGI